MRAAFHLLLLALILALGGCAGVATPAAPLPDARDLAEHPLDVTKIPQP